MDYKPYVRSLSPVSNKHNEINDLIANRKPIQKKRPEIFYTNICKVIRKPNDNSLLRSPNKESPRKQSPRKL